MDRPRIQKSPQNLPNLTPKQSEFDSKQISLSVSQFLKQSSEIQAQIQKISKLCQQISPKNRLKGNLKFPTDSFSETSQHPQQEPNWIQINSQLSQLGLRTLPLNKNSHYKPSPDFQSLSDLFLQILSQYKLKNIQLKNSEFSLSRLSSDHKQMQIQFKNLRLQVQKTKEKSPDQKTLTLRQNLKRKYDITSEDTHQFSNFMGRQINPNKFSDLKILELLLSKQNKKIQKSEKNSHPLLDMIVKQLSLSSYQEISPAIQKMQTVLQTLPNVENFFKLVCEEVQIGGQMKIQQVVPTIHKWKERNQKLKNLLGAMGGDYQVALERASAISYFCKLFDTSNQDLKEVVKGVYYFVHELKGFLAFARKCFRLPPDTPVADVLENIVQILKVT